MIDVTNTEPLTLFDRLANLFVEMGVFASPSECHGLLCGQMALGKAATEAEWLRDVAGYLEQHQIEGQAAKRELVDLYRLTDRQLRGTGFDLEIVVPDEDAELTQRAESIGLWCQGFLAGFGDSRIGQLSEEARETLEDFAEIARIEKEDLDDSEESEQDLMQVMEYVRMAAILIYSEVMGELAKDDSGPSRSLH